MTIDYWLLKELISKGSEGGNMRKDVVRELRVALSPLPDCVTDAEILEKTQGTLLLLSCEFRDLIREILRAWGLTPKF